MGSENPRRPANAINFNQTEGATLPRLEVHTMLKKNVIDIRNENGRLVGRFYLETATLVIKLKDCITHIRFLHNGELEVINHRVT